MSCALVSLLIHDVCLTLTLSLTQIFSILADREKSKGTGHNMRDKSTIKRLQMYRGGKPKRFVQMSITLVIYSILLLVVCQNECHIDYKCNVYMSLCQKVLGVDHPFFGRKCFFRFKFSLNKPNFI